VIIARDASISEFQFRYDIDTVTILAKYRDIHTIPIS